MEKKWIQPIIESIIVVIIAILGVWFFMHYPMTVPSPTLLSLSFKQYEFNPHIIDLRKTSEDGLTIPIAIDHGLELTDLWVSIPGIDQDLSGTYSIYAEIYLINSPDNVELIGRTASKSIKDERIYLGDVQIKNHESSPEFKSWHVTEDWEGKKLQIVLVTVRGNNVVNRDHTTFQLTTSRKSWLISSPIITIRSIMYSINDGPFRIVDMRNIYDAGIPVKPNDKLTIHEVWYHSTGSYEDSKGNSLTVELDAYLTTEEQGYNGDTALHSPKRPIDRGMHPLEDFVPMEWEISEDEDLLVLWLGRQDGVIIDSLEIPFKSIGNPGFIDAPFWASLSGLEFMVDDWNPHLADLRTLSSNGLPVRTGHGLQLSEIHLSIPKEYLPSLNYQLQAEVYIAGTNTLIGKTDLVHIKPENVSLGKVMIEAFHHGEYPGSWLIQNGWEALLLAVIAYDDTGKSTILSQTNIPLNPKSLAWMKDLPDANLIAAQYTVNDQSLLIADLRTATIQAAPGDTIALHNIWYNMSEQFESKNEMQLEVFLGEGVGFNDDTFKATSYHPMEIGIHSLDLSTPFTWVLSNKSKELVLTLARDDGVVMDRLRLQFTPEESVGLIEGNNIINWPFEYAESIRAEYIDFEKSSEIQEWRGEEEEEKEISLIDQTPNEAFSGEHAMAVNVFKDSKNTFVTWKHPLKAELIMGHVFWPEKKGVSIDWAIACIGIMGECVDIPIRQGEWNTFVFDLAQFKYNGQFLNTMKHSRFWLRGEISGDINKQNPYTFYVDGIQLFSLQE